MFSLDCSAFPKWVAKNKPTSSSEELLIAGLKAGAPLLSRRPYLPPIKREGTKFTILTDHKPITYAFSQKIEKLSPRQINHLNFIAQFTVDIKHISGKDNVVADALSRIKSISTYPLAYEDIARSQQDDEEELDLLLKQPTSMTLQKLQVPNTDVMLYCDISTQIIRPYIPKTHRYQVFRNLHDLAHPGVRATVRLICSRFVWPKMKQDMVNFTRSCIACQKSKIVRHVHSPLVEFKVPNQRFVHINIDIIGPLSSLQGLLLLPYSH
ncbi:hypothetical protein AVEN_4198-1 [Araneus ventricosus]|uniref:RNA-directed DNA polymerase n=1 Tax=Araneus ventricosus TaxID=182803 RepID=A0A4Y2FBA5_ARAVE|nr:hypothetical protein AVEN_4198-1 [Araneus ventricosus]